MSLPPLLVPTLKSGTTLLTAQVPTFLIKTITASGSLRGKGAVAPDGTEKVRSSSDRSGGPDYTGVRVVVVNCPEPTATLPAASFALTSK